DRSAIRSRYACTDRPWRWRARAAISRCADGRRPEQPRRRARQRRETTSSCGRHLPRLALPVDGHEDKRAMRHLDLGGVIASLHDGLKIDGDGRATDLRDLAVDRDHVADLDRL